MKSPSDSELEKQMAEAVERAHGVQATADYYVGLLFMRQHISEVVARTGYILRNP